MFRGGRLHHAFARALPKRLGARFALTVLLSNVVAVFVVFGLLVIAMRVVAPRLEDSAASVSLDSLDLAIRQQAATADASLAVLQVSTRIAEAGRTGAVPDDLATTLDAFAGAVNGSALVLIDPNGTLVYSQGEQAATSALSALLLDPAVSAPGVVSANGELQTIAVRDVSGPVGSTAYGRVGLLVPFDTSDLASQGSIVVDDPATTLPEIEDARVINDERFDDVLAWTEDGSLFVKSELRGADGRPAAIVTAASELAVQSWYATLLPWILAAALLAAGIGLAIGMLVARAVVKPIIELADTMGERALQTMEGSAPEPSNDHDLLPLELSNLLDVFDATFAELADHQIALARAKEDALANKATLDIAFQDSLEGKVLIKDSVVALVNPAARTHLGIRAGDVLGAPGVALFSSSPLFGSDGEDIEPASILESSLERETVVQLRAENRAPRWIELHTVMHGHDKDTLLVSTRDVTEERRVESLRTEVVGLVTHDLRAPLTVIAGYLDLLTHDVNDEARQKAVAAAQRSAVRMQDLLEDLLAATRAEEMFAPTEFARVELRELAEEVVVSFQHTSAHHLAVHADCPGTVLGEEKRLRQVLVNLVTNAMKYSPERSRVDVSVECVDSKVVLAVEDSGLGVPEVQRDKIFDRFTRLSSSDGTKQPGVGLGLYIVRAIIESHGGSVVATGRADGEQGARFQVTLPAAPSKD